MRWLVAVRGYITWVVFGEFPCEVCGRATMTRWTDLCEQHHRERLSSDLSSRS